MTNKILTVEEHLNNTNYVSDPSYVPSKFALEFVNFIKLVNGNQGEEHKTPVLHYKMLDNIAGQIKNTANMVHRGAAKALPLSTIIPTPLGPRRFGEIQADDYVFGPDGEPTMVLGVSTIFARPIYEITVEDGRTFRASEDHLHQINHYNNLEEKISSTVDTITLLKWFKDGIGMALPVTKPLRYTHMPLNGYEEGIKLIDGTHDKVPPAIAYNDFPVRKEFLQALMDKIGYNESRITYINFTGTRLDIPSVLDFLYGLGAIVHQHNQYLFEVDLSFNPYLYNHDNESTWLQKGNRELIITDIKEVELEPSRCIRVAHPTNLFLTENYLVTHNTTVLGEYLFLYLGVYGTIPEFGKVDLALYVSDSIDNGVKNMRKNLEFRWANSEFLQRYIPKIKFTDIRWEFTNIDGNTFIVKGYGAKTGVRGTKEKGVRPVLAVLDDLVSDEDARSPTVIASIEDTVYKAIDYAMHPTKQKIIWSGTPFNARDPLYKAVESGAWKVNVYPVCEKFPCERSEFRGSWPDRFTYDYVKEKYSKAVLAGKADTFNQELMLRIMSEEERLILDGEIRRYKRTKLLERRHNYNFYITTDFATSEKTASDFSVISVWAHNYNGDWFWVDGIIKNQLMDKNVDDLFKFVRQYKPISVGVEITGQQKGFIPWIQGEMINRNTFFQLASENNGNSPGIRPNTNKMERFNIIVPLFKMGKMYFPEEIEDTPEWREIHNELTLATVKAFKSKKDDFIDTVSMLASMSAWTPSEPDYEGTGNAMWDDDKEHIHNDLADSYIV